MVDPRVGSRELGSHFLKSDVAFELTPLTFGDVSFVGEGPTGPCMIGVERKPIRDLVNSLMSQRLNGHQLPGLVQTYDVTWLIIEGIWRANDDTGLIEIPRGREWVPVESRIEAINLEMWLLTLQMLGGVRVQATYGLKDTARYIAALQQWWTSKTWDEHKGHLALYQPIDRQLFAKPSLLRRWAAELPGIGYEKSKAIETAFGTPYAMAVAEAVQWRTIPGIGKILASRIQRVIHEGER